MKIAQVGVDDVSVNLPVPPSPSGITVDAFSFLLPIWQKSSVLCFLAFLLTVFLLVKVKNKGWLSVGVIVDILAIILFLLISFFAITVPYYDISYNFSGVLLILIPFALLLVSLGLLIKKIKRPEKKS